MQFKRAIHIATWVCGAIIRGPSADVVSKMDVHQDTPIMCAKQLLRAAQVRQYFRYFRRSAVLCATPCFNLIFYKL